MSSASLQELPQLRKKAPTVRRIRFENVVFAPWNRPVEQPRVERIVKEFDVYKVRRPLLGPAEKTDTFNICDGQHTFRALQAMGFEWWEMDVADISEAEQIKRFANQRDNVRNVSPLDQIHAQHLGYDMPKGFVIPEFQRAREIVDAIHEAGWDYQRGRRRGHGDCSNAMTVITTSGIEEVYDKAEAMQKGHGKVMVTQTLRDIADTWPNDGNATEPAMIRAMGKVIRVYGGLTDAQKVTLGAVPTATIKLAVKGLGHQDRKRDLLAEHIRKDILGLHSKGEFRNN